MMSKGKQLLLGYLTKRPCLLSELVEEYGPTMGKSGVQKVLDDLVTDGAVRVKCYGKQKIYFPTPTDNLTTAERQREFLSCTQAVQRQQQSIKQKQAECQELRTKLKAVNQQQQLLASLTEERGQILDEIRTLNEQLRKEEAAQAAAAAASTNKAPEPKLTPQRAEEISKRYAHVASAYRKRKRICCDMLEAILEGCPLTKRALIEDIGVETDEEAGFNVKVQH